MLYSNDEYSEFHDYYQDKLIELIDNDLLTIYFQPIYSINDGSVYAYEALTRIKDNILYDNIGDLFSMRFYF